MAAQDDEFYCLPINAQMRISDGWNALAHDFTLSFVSASESG
ncbi:hypothetical protein VDG1235_896 [Verrucomicrobiia bacterium DG1235]|nr:hypothetical protein VDG1235_896 [Verrucomicrobiae bacterium DG1235]